jgi:hypothetical protein
VKKNRLLIALVVLIGVGALAMTAARSHQPVTTVAEPEEKLPEIKKDALTAIELVSPGKETIALQKKGEDWEVVSPVSAKADKTAVDSVLDKLSSLEVAGIAATRKENHARLQVDADKAIRVKAKAGDKVVADLFIGMTKSGSTMVRAEGKEQVVSVRGAIRYVFDKELKMFRDRVITDIDTGELSAISVESEKGKFRFEKADTAWKQAEGEKKLKDFADSKVQSFASTMSRLRAADFGKPEVDAAKAGLDKPLAKVTLERKNAGPTVIELGALVDDRDYYARVSGKDVLFRISKSTGERMLADATAFTAEPKKEGEEAEPEAPPMPALGGGGNQLPPELLEQLQKQMAQGHP